MEQVVVGNAFWDDLTAELNNREFLRHYVVESMRIATVDGSLPPKQQRVTGVWPSGGTGAMWTELLHSSVQQRARELVWLDRHSGVQVVERRHGAPRAGRPGAVGHDELFGITRSTVYGAVTRAGGPDGAALGQATSGRPSVTGAG